MHRSLPVADVSALRLCVRRAQVVSTLRSLETLDLEDNELGEADQPGCGFEDGVSTLARLQCLNIAQCAARPWAGLGAVVCWCPLPAFRAALPRPGSAAAALMRACPRLRSCSAHKYAQCMPDVRGRPWHRVERVWAGACSASRGVLQSAPVLPVIGWMLLPFALRAFQGLASGSGMLEACVALVNA